MKNRNTSKSTLVKTADKKLHPWRMCPLGQYWVSTHPLKTKITQKNPDGLTTRHGHCRTNPSKKDQLYPDEIHEIANNYFTPLQNLPSPDPLKRDDGNKYDQIIAGWTQYWNEVFESTDPLDPNLIKALISTESDFKKNAKVLASKGNWARGLTQITDQTIEILKDEKGELRDFLINLDENKASDPNLNICAGIRWLFHKKKLKRTASWEEAVIEYKSYTEKLKKGEKSALKQWDKFLGHYKKLKK